MLLFVCKLFLDRTQHTILAKTKRDSSIKVLGRIKDEGAQEQEYCTKSFPKKTNSGWRGCVLLKLVMSMVITPPTQKGT